MDPQTQPELSSEAPDDSASDVSAKVSAQQLLLHNAVLRRNFEHLKDLHLKLSQANLNLRETCRQLQFEKIWIQSLEENNKALACKMEIMRYLNLVLLSTFSGYNFQSHQPENKVILQVLKGIKLLQKRRHLKLNIPSWSHQKEKSNHIERKWGISLIREDICTFEQERESDQKAWKMEKFDFQKQMDEYERDKEKNKDIRGNLEAEVADLHAMLTGLEQVIQDAEKRHADAIKLMRNIRLEMEKETILCEEAARSQDKIVKLLRKKQMLKKSLKQSYKVLALMASDYNKLKAHLQEHKDKKKLSSQVSSKINSYKHRSIKARRVKKGTNMLSSMQKSMYSNDADLKEDMNKLADRQMKLLNLLTYA